jgi:hypothetical protein
MTDADFLRIVTGGSIWPGLANPRETIVRFWVDGQRVAVWLHL